MKVWPQTTTARTLLKHPSGRGFYQSGYVNWPFDNFTLRRLNDGSVADWFVRSRFRGSGSLAVDATVEQEIR